MNAESPATVNSTSAPCRLFGLLARQASVGVLLRRGPSSWVRLIRWNTQDDSFERGDWFHGRINERRCDLSPSGRQFVYFAKKFSARTLRDFPTFLDEVRAWLTGNTERRDRHYTYSWTAVSRPPWLAALALWPKGDCRRGGGLFESESDLLLNHPPGDRCHPDHRPEGLNVRPLIAGGGNWPIYAARLLRDGWTLEKRGHFPSGLWKGRRAKEPEIWRRACPSGSAQLEMIQEDWSSKAFGGPYVLRFRVRRDAATPWADLGRATWGNWDHRGRLVLARNGGLYHCELPATGDPHLRLIADFNDESPEPITPPPSAWTWPTTPTD